MDFIFPPISPVFLRQEGTPLPSLSNSSTPEPFHNHPEHPDLIAWNALNDRVRLRGNVWGEVWGRSVFNQPVVQSDQASVQNVYQGTIGILSEFRLESDYQISWLKGVPFFENVLSGKTRFDHVGVHATVDNVEDGVKFDLVGDLTHTWPDIPLSKPEENRLNPALSISIYSTGHRHAEDFDIFLPEAHGSMGILAYERATGFFGQFGGEHTENLPWGSALMARLGWMMPLGRIYRNLGWEELSSSLGGGPHSHGMTTTALPNASDDIWERSKIAIYYQWKNYSDPNHPDFTSLEQQFPDFDASHVTAREQSLGIYVEHRFNTKPSSSALLNGLFADSRLLVGADYKAMQIIGEENHVSDGNQAWFAPRICLEKSFSFGGRNALTVNLSVARDRIAGSEQNGSFTFKPVTTVALRVSLSF